MWFSLLWKFYWAGARAHEYTKLRTVLLRDVSSLTCIALYRVIFFSGEGQAPFSDPSPAGWWYHNRCCKMLRRHILLSDSANCTMLRAIVLTQYRRVTDGQTDGIAVASTALAKQRTVKNVCRIWGIVGWLIMGKLDVIHKTGST